MRNLAPSLALAFALYAALSSSFAHQLREAWDTQRSYRELRVGNALGGLDIEALRARLDACLPSSRSVALGPELVADSSRNQRLTELLYPRLVDSTSRFTLKQVDRSRLEPATMVPLVRLDDTTELVLSGTCSPEAARDAVLADRTRLALPRWLFSAAGTWGFGLFAWWLVARLLRRDLEPVPVWLSSATVLALLTAGTTVLQWRLPWTPLRVLGILLGTTVLVATRARWSKWLRAIPGRLRREPETLLVAALLGAFTLLMAVWPVTGWDGRSIWLFHARRIFFHGMFASEDLLNVDAAWSHTRYPPLLPGWLAVFGADGPVFNERSAAISLGLLLAGVLGPLWRVSRERLGRWVGCAFTVGAFLGVQQLCSWGYADGFLALLLVIQVLGLGSSRFRAEGWLAACAASLLKQEGALLAELFALIHVALEVRATPTWGRRARAALPLLSLLPARLYVRWLDAQGLHSDFTQPNWADFLAHPVQRLETILGAFPAAVREVPVLLPGLVAALAAAAFLPGWVRRAPRERMLTALAPAVAVAFGVGVFLVTPFPLEWHLKTAFARVLLHASMLLVCAALLSTAPEASGLSPGMSWRSWRPAQPLRPDRSRDAA